MTGDDKLFSRENNLAKREKKQLTLVVCVVEELLGELADEGVWGALRTVHLRGALQERPALGQRQELLRDLGV